MNITDEVRLLTGGLPYFYFTREELAIFIDKDLRTQAIRHYLYMRLNCNIRTGISHTINYKEMSNTLTVHRTTSMRALADLEDAGLISPRNKVDGETYDLPYVAYAKATAEETDRNKKQREGKKKYAAEKESIEGVLSRRLTEPEKKRLKEKHGLI